MTIVMLDMVYIFVQTNNTTHEYTTLLCTHYTMDSYLLQFLLNYSLLINTYPGFITKWILFNAWCFGPENLESLESCRDSTKLASGFKF